MGTIKMRNACAALRDLQNDPDYQTMEATSELFNAFRQRVEIAAMTCVAVAPSDFTEAQVRELLEELQDFCTGNLAKFRPFIDRALQAL